MVEEEGRLVIAIEATMTNARCRMVVLMQVREDALLIFIIIIVSSRLFRACMTSRSLSIYLTALVKRK